MPFWFEVVLVASVAFDQGMRGAFARFHVSRPCPTSAAGDSFAARTDLCHHYSFSPVENFIGDVVETGEQFIAGVVDTSEQFISDFSPMWLIPVRKNLKA
jgi:hypothetical protein